MERSGVLPTTQFAYQRGLGTCDAILCLSHTLQRALESGQEARIVQIDFSAALDRLNHQGILYKLCSVGIGGPVPFILTQFLSNRSQQVWWMVIGVNWLTLCQECRRVVFYSRYCSSCTLRSFFSFWKISWSVMLMTPLDGCCAIPMRYSPFRRSAANAIVERRNCARLSGCRVSFKRSVWPVQHCDQYNSVTSTTLWPVQHCTVCTVSVALTICTTCSSSCKKAEATVRKKRSVWGRESMQIRKMFSWY